jgi:hypothetical protein
MTNEKEKLECGFPPEVRTWTRRDMVECMPPVLDEETGEITFYCAICKKVKTVPEDQHVGYFTRRKSINNGFGVEGNVCRECEAAGGY